MSVITKGLKEQEKERKVTRYDCICAAQTRCSRHRVRSELSHVPRTDMDRQRVPG